MKVGEPRQQLPTIEEIRLSFAPVLKQSGALRAIVFGSYARGEADEYSDLDLIIVADTERKFLDRADDYFGLHEVWKKGIDMLVYTPQELSAMLEEGRYFIDRALEEGVVIYEK